MSSIGVQRRRRDLKQQAYLKAKRILTSVSAYLLVDVIENFSSRDSMRQSRHTKPITTPISLDRGNENVLIENNGILMRGSRAHG